MNPDLRVVEFKPWHYAYLADDRTQAAVPVEVIERLEGHGSWTGLWRDEPIVVAGLVPQWPGRHIAWAYFARGTLRHLPWISERVMEKLAEVKGRVELTVRADFRAGHRWAKRLGFEVETPRLRAYGPEGEDHVGYVRIG